MGGYALSDQRAKCANVTARRFRPQSPGGPSKTPAHGVPQFRQRPSPVKFQAVISYQSRPIARAPQPWQWVLSASSSWTLPT